MFSFFKASRFLLKGKYRVIATLLANILPCTDSLEIGRALNHKGGEVSLSTGFCQITAFLVIHLTVFFEHPLVPEIMQLSLHIYIQLYIVKTLFCGILITTFHVSGSVWDEGKTHVLLKLGSIKWNHFTIVVLRFY